ncbi:MAG: hypothetical protein BMS9Abin26_0434 [Gammaproteobacteria bacterium]|nr:MAG: hypothetical protein BMS9Abin26_0434 [Gammaproteobacteria bacterium]
MIRLILILLMLGTALSAYAQTVYVTDKVLLGVYREKGQSELVKVVPTGTPLEILEKDGNNARVRDPDGVEGWVDASYLVNNKPAQLQILDLTDKHRQATEDLKKSRADVEKLSEQVVELKKKISEDSAASQGSVDAKEFEKLTAQYKKAKKDLKKLRKENKKLARKLKSTDKDDAKNSKALKDAATNLASSQDSLKKANATIRELEAKLKARPVTTDKVSDINSEKVTKLQADYDALKSRIDNAMASLSGNAAAEGSNPITVISGENNAGISSNLMIILAVIILILGFAAGASWLDRKNLRRHGGFRI